MRRLKEALFLGAVGLLSLAGLAVLGVVVGVIAWKGLGAIHWGFLTSASEDFGAKGGIFYQITGSLILVLGAGALALPSALGTALYLTEYARRPWVRQAVAQMLYALNGVPSIIFGLFGFAFFVTRMQLGVSWVSGILILGIMILPTVTVVIKETLESIPYMYRDAGLALGLTRWQMIRSVLLPQSLSGIATALLLGLARAAGETAPIMFTAACFTGVTIPHSLREPVPTLTTHVLTLAQESSNPLALKNAWGTAFVLLCLVFLMALSSMWIRARFRMERAA
ncbi:MAG: phosphate ABC transporter permease PstA [Armatimonadetes bacterium]|nr:phosphate ABC transporter permease PstA [Armatimonadota bacterium]